MLTNQYLWKSTHCRYSVSRMGNDRGWSRIRWPLLTVFAFLLLGPIWLFRHLPLVDYPDHLARAYVLTHLDDPAYGGFYRSAWGPYPYLAGDLLLVALQKVVPIDVAGRLLLSLCALSVPAASWLFLRRANPGSTMLAMWSLPLSYNLFFLSGFMNMQLSMALCLVVLTAWLRWKERPSRKGWLLLFLLVNLLYFTHLMGFAVAALVIVYIRLRERANPLPDMLLFFPALLMYAYLVLGADLRLRSAPFRLDERLVSPLLALESHYLWLDWATVGILLGCVIGAIWQNKEFGWNRRWTEVAFALYVVSWFLPAGGATSVNIRVMPSLCLIAPAAVRVGARLRVLAAIGLLVFVVRVGAVMHYFSSEQPELAAMEEAIAATERGARVLPLIGWRGDSLERWTYVHFWATGVIRKGWRSPYLFHDPGVHPLRSQSLYMPAERLPAAYSGAFDWNHIEQDYDYVWAYNVPIATELQARGEVVYQHGMLLLVKLRGTECPPCGKQISEIMRCTSRAQRCGPEELCSWRGGLECSSPASWRSR